MAKTDIIEINGRRYDAASGQPLDEQPRHKMSAKAHKVAHHTSRANNVRRHAPAASKLLMRQATKKPAKHTRIKASGALKAKPALSELAPLRRAEKRLSHAKHTPKSQLISHFVRQPASPYPVDTVFQPTPAEQVTVRRVAPAASRPKPVRATATEELLERALREATSHEQKPLPKRRRRLLKTRNRLFAKPHAA